MDPELKENLKKNAVLVIKQFKADVEFEFGCNEKSVKWVDGFINRQRAREDFSLELVGGLTNTLGSFLGECIIASYGGDWGFTDDGLGVVFDDENAAYPIGKVRKHFENGEEDSIYSFYSIIPLVYPHLKGEWVSFFVDFNGQNSQVL